VVEVLDQWYGPADAFFKVRPGWGFRSKAKRIPGRT